MCLHLSTYTYTHNTHKHIHVFDVRVFENTRMTSGRMPACIPHMLIIMVIRQTMIDDKHVNIQFIIMIIKHTNNNNTHGVRVCLRAGATDRDRKMALD